MVTITSAAPSSSGSAGNPTISLQSASRGTVLAAQSSIARSIVNNSTAVSGAHQLVVKSGAALTVTGVLVALVL